MKMKIKLPVNMLEASASQLASFYKFRGIERQAAWSRFVIDRGLKPEIDAKDFYAEYDQAEPANLIQETEIDFIPTHFDEFLRVTCMITPHDDKGYFSIVWFHRATGGEPIANLDAGRYTPIQ